MINATTIMITLADENSFIFGVGVGSVTVLLLGTKNACIAQAFAESLYGIGLRVEV